MTTGENAGTWGTTTNTNLQIIEQISGGYVEQAISSTTTTLSVSDGSTGATLGHRIIKFTGTLSGNSTVTIPLDVQQMYILVNGTSGTYTLTFKYVSGSGSTVAFGTTDKGTKIVYAAADHATNPNMVDTGISTNTLTGVTGDITIDSPADIIFDADGADFKFKDGGTEVLRISNSSSDVIIKPTVDAKDIIFQQYDATEVARIEDGVQFNVSATTASSSATTGALITGGGLGVAADAYVGDDVYLISDSAILGFGADKDTTLTHTDGTGLTLNSTNKLCFYDTALYIHSSTDGQLDLVADTEIQIAATTIDINGAVALNGAITGATDITLSGELDAATLDISGNADIDGTTNLDAVDIDGAVQLDATLTVGADDQGYDIKFFGDTASAYMLWDTSADDLILGGAAGLIVPDGQFTLGSTAVTTTAAEINLIDGGTSRGTTAVADGDGLLVNDDGTMRMTNVTTLKTYFQTGVSVAADDISTGDGAVTIATSSGNITIDAQAGDTDIIFKGTDSSTDTTALTLDMSDAGTAIFNNDVVLDSDSAVLKFGDDQDVTLTHTDGTGLTLNSTSKLTFGDAATYINQSSDGVMTVAGEATIDLTASTAVLVSNDLKLDSDSSVLSFGADDDTTLTHTDGTGLTLNSTNKLCFNDASQFIQGSSATVLSIGATDEIDLTATAVDLNGTLNVSGVATFQSAPVFPDGSIAVADLDIDGATDIGEAIVDADLFIIDNGAGGTNRKVAASRIVTYIDANSSAATVGKAIAMAIVFG
jgi:hypothetical protein